jgi:glycosyltransferase involved in cell wall biosynthesis
LYTPDTTSLGPQHRLQPAASVILSTYNHPPLLERTLLGYARQSELDFELVLADDGSGPETAKLIARLGPLLPFPLVHTWQPDRGFRKARAVNLAVLRSRASYLIFSDGDCIPARGFVQDHLRAARPGHFVVGGHVRLSRAQTHSLCADDVSSGRFEALASASQRLALRWTHWKSLLYIALRKRRKPKFYGLNFSVDRASFARVNGFDMTFENCGREDSDLRNRMRLAGIGALSLWDRVGVYHQHHPGHSSRTGWLQVPLYYNRPISSPEAPQGLRELVCQLTQGEPAPRRDPRD